MRGDDPRCLSQRRADEFPACAGMIRFVVLAQSHNRARVPRMRGDDPSAQFTVPVVVQSSPHARG